MTQAAGTAVSDARTRTGLNTEIHLSATMGATITLALIAFVAGFVVPVDFDYWWHLADGRYIVAHHALPVPDIFSFTAAGHQFVAHEWLSEVWMYLLHQAFGIRGPVALYAGCMVVVALFSFSTLRRLGVRDRMSFGLTCLMVIALWAFIGPRPQVAGFTLTATVLWLLERWIARPDRTIWLLPPLMWLWGNLHGSYAIGLALSLLILAGDGMAAIVGWESGARLRVRERVRLGAAIGISIALLAINPNGLAILAYPFSKLHDPLARAAIAEFMAPDLSKPFLWPFASLVALYGALIVLRRPHLPAADLLLAMALVGAALSTEKYVPYAVICLTLLTGRVLGQPNHGDLHAPAWLNRLRVRRSHRTTAAAHTQQAQVANIVALLTFAMACLLIVRQIDPMSSVRQMLPIAAIDAMETEGLRGPIFNNYNWGGYLIWRQGLQTKVFIDGRGDDLYINGGVLQNYLDVVGLRPNADQVLEKYHIQTVLFEKDAPLIRYLLAEGGWVVTYDDGRVVRLERQTARLI